MSHKKYDCNHPIITFTKLIFSFSKKILYLRIRHIRMARKQQYRLPERAGMCSVVISSLKFDNKSTWNNPKISVPKMCKIVVSWSLKERKAWFSARKTCLTKHEHYYNVFLCSTIECLIHMYLQLWHIVFLKKLLW